ncbi:MAG: anti-sigma factor [Actinomycetota bacterium]
MSDATELHLLAGAYALNALDPDERELFEAHLQDSRSSQQDVAEFQETAAVLATAAAATPPSSLRADVLDEIRRTRQQSPLPAVASAAATTGPTPNAGGSSRDRWRSLAAAAGTTLVTAAAVVLVAVGAWYVTRPDPSDIDDSIKEAENVENVDALLTAPDAVVTTLHASDAGDASDVPTTTIKVVFSSERGQVGVVAGDLDAVDDGVTYALWLIDDSDAATAVGRFVPHNGDVSVILDVNDAPDHAAGWGVTVEPHGELGPPTPPVHFTGTS